MSEGVDELEGAEDLVEPCALLGKEAGVLAVRFVVREVDFLVRDVPVATDDVVAAGCGKAGEVSRELLDETKLRGEAYFAAGAGGYVQRHDAQVAQARFDVAALRIKLGGAEAVDHLVGLLPREDGYSAMPFALSRLVETVIPGRCALGVGELLRSYLDLLQANEVCLLAREPVVETLAHSSAESVGVQAEHAHRNDRTLARRRAPAGIGDPTPGLRQLLENTGPAPGTPPASPLHRPFRAGYILV